MSDPSIKLCAAICAVALALPSPSFAQSDDPAPLRLALLREMDEQINQACARAHLEARLMLDKVMPIAFLGMVADDAEQGGMKVNQIYRRSAADRVGLRTGDIILELAGVPTPEKNLLYREIRRHGPKETIELKILRAGKPMSLSPVLGIRWQEDEEDAEQFADIVPPPVLGVGLPVRLDFEEDLPGSRPAVFEQTLGGTGRAPGFLATRDDHALFLRQVESDDMGLRFPMAILCGVDAHDVVGRIRFRLVDGAQDRTAGIVLHYQDPSNYLVARVNAVEGDLRMFRTVNGLRRTLPGGVINFRPRGIDLDDDKWHTLEFGVDGPKVFATLDREHTVSSYDTFFVRGGVGLWTKSDSITDFDDVEFVEPKR